ncbi:MAG TPA: ChbG/HpnK family deacetylase [Gaiellales bacterium]|jgi:predicted glycoside hydrolase/deacetylase ChbG (UPF0249 family)
MSRRVIFNADDFGLTPGVNAAIKAAHERGILTSTTVLTGMAAAAEAEQLRRDCPDLDIGLHVNLTLGMPTSDPGRIRSIVDGAGRLLSERALAEGLMRRTVQSRDIYREVQSQAIRLRGLGVDPTHWDAHRAVAFWPIVLAATAAAAWDSGITRVRSPRVWVADPTHSAIVAKLRWRCASSRRWATEANRYVGLKRLRRRFALPDWLFSANLVIGPEAYAERWNLLFDRLPMGLCEVSCHPGTVDEDLIAVTPGLTDERKVDLDALTDPGSAERLRELGVELVGFRNLPVHTAPIRSHHARLVD